MGSAFRLGVETKKIFGGLCDAAINLRLAWCLSYAQQDAHHQITPE
jgi:hypothetical protein